MEKEIFLNDLDKYLKECKYFNLVTVLHYSDVVCFIALAHIGDINKDSVLKLKFTANELERITNLLDCNGLKCRKNYSILNDKIFKQSDLYEFRYDYSFEGDYNLEYYENYTNFCSFDGLLTLAKNGYSIMDKHNVLIPFSNLRFCKDNFNIGYVDSIGDYNEIINYNGKLNCIPFKVTALTIDDTLRRMGILNEANAVTHKDSLGISRKVFEVNLDLINTNFINLREILQVMDKNYLSTVLTEKYFYETYVLGLKCLKNYMELRNGLTGRELDCTNYADEYLFSYDVIPDLSLNEKLEILIEDNYNLINKVLQKKDNSDVELLKTIFSKVLNRKNNVLVIEALIDVLLQARGSEKDVIKFIGKKINHYNSLKLSFDIFYYKYRSLFIGNRYLINKFFYETFELGGCFNETFIRKAD